MILRRSASRAQSDAMPIGASAIPPGASTAPPPPNARALEHSLASLVAG